MTNKPINISKIHYTHKETFFEAFLIAMDVYNFEPDNIPPKKQRSIRKYVYSYYIKNTSYPKSVSKYLEADNETFFKFLKACYNEVKQNGTLKEQRFKAETENLSKDVKEALWEVIGNDTFYGNTVVDGTTVTFFIINDFSMVKTLTLKNASNIPKAKFDCIHFGINSFVSKDSEYRLTGSAEDYSLDTEKPFSIRFDSLETEFKIYNATSQPFTDTPWKHIDSVTFDIMEKYSQSPDYLNNAEKELLPLIADIRKLSVWYPTFLPTEFKNCDLAHLKFYFKKYNYTKLIKLAERFETLPEGFKQRYTAARLSNLLNLSKYEPLWREIYSLIAASQSDYPVRVEAEYPAEKLKQIRKEVSEHLKAFGFEGTYPDFHKKADLKKLRLTESYETSYFVGLQKNVTHYIHCSETYFSGELNIEFLCAADLVKKSPNKRDIYSCLFNTKGHTTFSSTTYCHHAEENAKNDLKTVVGIAVKKAELQKLSKKEQTIDKGFYFSNWKLFFSIFFFMGGLFSLLFNGAMYLFTIFMLQLDGFPISEAADLPWWIFIIFTWVAFGGAMGIITVLAKRK